MLKGFDKFPKNFGRLVNRKMYIIFSEKTWYFEKDIYIM